MTPAPRIPKTIRITPIKMARNHHRPGASFRLALTRLLGFAAVVATAGAADFPFTFTKNGAAYRLTLQQNSAVYFGVHHTGDLLQPFTTIHMALGTPGPIFEYTPDPGETRGFFRIEGIPNNAPGDADFDGMDDLWELQHPAYLDPLNSADAFALSPEPDAAGLTNLQYYIRRFGLSTNKPQYYSREVSLFNHGAPVFGVEALSREYSLFNFGAQWNAIEAFSREISVFNGEAPPIEGYPEIYSREVSLYNFGSPPFSIEALSREVSVFNGEAPPIEGYPEIYSREISVFNHGAPIYAVEALSREVSVFNNIAP